VSRPERWIAQLHNAEVYLAKQCAMTFDGNQFPVAFCSDGNKHKAVPAQHLPFAVDSEPTPKPAISQYTLFLNEWNSLTPAWKEARRLSAGIKWNGRLKTAEGALI